MVTYDFKCESCLHLFERLCKVGTIATECPECGDNSQKLFSVNLNIIKGSGFYSGYEHVSASDFMPPEGWNVKKSWSMDKDKRF